MGSDRNALDEGMGAPAGGRIGSITYRSRSNGKPDWVELDELTRAAQRRNRAAGLTGLLVYEDGRFFQCIEGPPEALDRVWNAIQRDRRHREVDVISMHIGAHRMFDGWDMRWLRRGDRADDASPELPALAFLEPDAPSERLARLALDADPSTLTAELARTHPRASLATLLDYVIEPAARALGDAWMRDDIDGASMAMALARLGHAVHDRGRTPGAEGVSVKRLLSIALPGEPHFLGAVATAELFSSAGWSVDLEFPGTIGEVLRLVAASEYDRVDIAISDAIDRASTREEAPDLARLIRQASRNPEVEISFGGRAFWKDDASTGLPGCTFRSTAASMPPPPLGLR